MWSLYAWRPDAARHSKQHLLKWLLTTRPSSKQVQQATAGRASAMDRWLWLCSWALEQVSVCSKAYHLPKHPPGNVALMLALLADDELCHIGGRQLDVGGCRGAGQLLQHLPCSLPVL